MKKILSFIGALVLLANNLVAPVVYADDSTNLDILLSKKVTLGIIEPTQDIVSKCDTNLDDVVNIFDVINLKNSYLQSNTIDLSKYQLISGYNNLYNITEISNDSENSYVSIDTIGNNLFVCNRFADEMFENVSYDLSIYDISQGKISYTLKNIFFDDYYIIDNKIILWDYQKRTISIYDDTLQLINTYDISSMFSQEDWISFYPCDVASVVYVYHNDNSKLYRIHLDDIDNYETFDFPYHNLDIYNLTADGQITACGLNSQNLKYEIVYWDLEKNIAEYTQNSSYCYGLVDDTILNSVDYENSIWSIQSINQDAKYFKIKDTQSVELNSNKDIISITDDGSNKYINIYDIDGINKSTIKFKNDSFYYNVKQISNTDYYYLINDNNGNYTIMLWDTSNSTKIDDLQSIPNYDTTKSMIGNIDDLSNLYLQAEDIANEYGINIYIGDTIIDELGGYSLEPCLDYEVITESLDKLETILSCYPTDFFTQLYTGSIYGLNFYLSGTIAGNSSDTLDYAGGFVTESNSTLNMCIDCNEIYDWDFILNHEIAHLIDDRLYMSATFNQDAVFSEDTWNSYNPISFEYSNSYDEYWTNSCNYDYFIRDYSTTYPTEDRADIFGYAMECYLNPNSEDYFISSNTIKGKKLKYYSNAIRDSFDTSNWADVMSWEQVLYSNTYEDTFVFPFEDYSVYNIKNLGSGKYLNVDYGKDINATNVYQWTGDGSIEQKFRLSFWGKAYKINAMCSSNGYDKTLDIVKSNGNVVSDANVEIYESIDDVAQEWLFVEVEKGVYKIVPKYNTDLALSVYGKDNGSGSGTTSTSNGNVFVSTYTGDDSQKWILTQVDN